MQLFCFGKFYNFREASQVFPSSRQNTVSDFHHDVQTVKLPALYHCLGTVYADTIKYQPRVQDAGAVYVFRIIYEAAVTRYPRLMIRESSFNE